MAFITIGPSNGVTQKFDVAYIGTTLALNATNFPWYTAANVTAVYAKSSNRQGYVSAKPGVSLTAVSQLILAVTGGLPNVYELNLKAPITLDTTQFYVIGAVTTLPALATPAGTQATGTSATTISVSASSVAGADGYRLFTSATQTGTYSRLGGILTAPAYTHTGLSAGLTQWYQWQAVGNGVTSSDSPRSPAFSGVTGAATLPTPVRGDGHSIMTRYGADGDPSIVENLATILGNTTYTDFRNAAVPGQTAAQMLTRAQSGGADANGGASFTDSTVLNRTGQNFGITVVYGALNSLYAANTFRIAGDTASYEAAMKQLRTDYTAYATLVAAKNNRIIYLEEAAAANPTFSAAQNAAYLATIQDWNSFLLTDYATTLKGAGLVRTMTDKAFADTAATTNSMYYIVADQTHFVGGGRLRLANLAAQAVTAVASGQTGVVIYGESAAGGTPTNTVPPGVKAIAPTTGVLFVEAEDGSKWIDDTGIWVPSSQPNYTYYLNGFGRISENGNAGDSVTCRVYARYIDLFAPLVSGAATISYSVKRVSDGGLVGMAQTLNQNAADQKEGYPDGSTPAIAFDAGVLDYYDVTVRNALGGSVAFGAIRISRATPASVPPVSNANFDVTNLLYGALDLYADNTTYANVPPDYKASVDGAAFVGCTNVATPLGNYTATTLTLNLYRIPSAASSIKVYLDNVLVPNVLLNASGPSASNIKLTATLPGTTFSTLKIMADPAMLFYPQGTAITLS
jgi:hypothetical protein